MTTDAPLRLTWLDLPHRTRALLEEADQWEEQWTHETFILRVFVLREPVDARVKALSISTQDGREHCFFVDYQAITSNPREHFAEIIALFRGRVTTAYEREALVSPVFRDPHDPNRVWRLGHQEPNSDHPMLTRVIGSGCVWADVRSSANHPPFTLERNTLWTYMRIEAGATLIASEEVAETPAQGIPLAPITPIVVERVVDPAEYDR